MAFDPTEQIDFDKLRTHLQEEHQQGAEALAAMDNRKALDLHDHLHNHRHNEIRKPPAPGTM